MPGDLVQATDVPLRVDDEIVILLLLGGLPLDEGQHAVHEAVHVLLGGRGFILKYSATKATAKIFYGASKSWLERENQDAEQGEQRTGKSQSFTDLNVMGVEEISSLAEEK